MTGIIDHSLSIDLLREKRQQLMLERSNLAAKVGEARRLLAREGQERVRIQAQIVEIESAEAALRKAEWLPEPHAFELDYSVSGQCGAMISLQDDSGDQCGLPKDHRTHTSYIEPGAYLP